MMPHNGRYIPAHLVVARGDLDAAVDIYKDSERVISAMDDPYLAGKLNGNEACFASARSNWMRRETS